MVQLNPTQLRGFIRKKTSNSQIISNVCECLLNVVNGNVPVSIPNINKFETAYKILINPKKSPEKKTSYYTEQTRILSNQTNTLFLLQVFDCIEMAADEFVLIPKHMYIRDQPHAAQLLLDNSIKHKKPQLSYLNRLRPLNESARTTNNISY